ncbi:MAG: glucose 1-dehydrogenase [Anaerolineae bacterium]|jgi:NAD(P)-dependent dehydrogenase (short-subunit alcohol dehydrogenase family)|nr:glucose 1-dehydrogenase [Anaerolineae bacterium]
MSALFEVKDKVAVITGASRGIGLAIAHEYAKAGMKVVISSRKQDSLDQVATEIRSAGGEVTAIAAHNGDKAALQHLIEQTIAVYGGVDVLVNNAATNPHFGTLLEAEDSLWQKTFEVNLLGNVWLTQAAVKSMRPRGGGKIINIASVNGLRPGHYQGIYSITKAGVINLTQTLAMELAADNIQVNAIAPGLIKTKFAQAIWENETLMEGVIERTPVQRIGEPQEIAGIALYLAAPASSFTTGQVFVVDGGITVPML